MDSQCQKICVGMIHVPEFRCIARRFLAARKYHGIIDKVFIQHSLLQQMGAVGRRLDTELFQPPFLKGIHEHLCIGVLSLARHYNRERVKICVKLTMMS